MDIATIGVFMVCFTFFNSFVGSVFWYLFNDVVPEHLLARFMSLFRLVSLATASVYKFFIFRYAGTHSTEIMVGISLLYFFGFGLMCLMVKEGQYPPAPAYVDGQADAFSAIKTFAQECLTLPHYWYIFLISIFGSFGGAAGVVHALLLRVDRHEPGANRPDHRHAEHRRRRADPRLRAGWRTASTRCGS